MIEKLYSQPIELYSIFQKKYLSELENELAFLEKELSEIDLNANDFENLVQNLPFREVCYPKTISSLVNEIKLLKDKIKEEEDFKVPEVLKDYRIIHDSQLLSFYWEYKSTNAVSIIESNNFVGKLPFSFFKKINNLISEITLNEIRILSFIHSKKKINTFLLCLTGNRYAVLHIEENQFIK